MLSPAFLLGSCLVPASLSQPGSVSSSGLLGREATSEGLRWCLTTACEDLLGREGTPLRGPSSESGRPNGQRSGAAHQGDGTPSAVRTCCRPSGSRLSPPGHMLQERLQEDTPPRRIGAADLKARKGLKRVPSPQSGTGGKLEVSGEKNRPDM